MKKLILTFALLCAVTFVNAQTQTITVPEQVNGQWVTKTYTVTPNTMFNVPGRGNMSVGEYVNMWNAAYKAQTTTMAPSAPVSTQDPYVAAANMKTLEMYDAQIDNTKADTRQKNTQTILNIAGTVVNGYVALDTNRRNNLITNSYLFGNGGTVVNSNWNTHQPVNPNNVWMNGMPANNVTILNPNQVWINQQGQNMAWSGNCGVAGSAMGVKTF